MAKRKSNTLGVWAFTIGVVVAIVLGFINVIWELPETTTQLLLVLLGITGVVVGLMNINSDEAMSFLMVAAVLVISIYAGGEAMEAMWPSVSLAFRALNVFFVPMTIIVAVRALFTLARD
jgi:uncharacterized membrane protein YccC